jgi:hypothetical protein
MNASLGTWESARRALRVLDALALPSLLFAGLTPFLGRQSLTIWVAGGMLMTWLAVRVFRAIDWDAPYRMWFLKLITFACSVSLMAAFVSRTFS